MATDQSIPCPMCGRLNRLDRKTCHTCHYAFVPDAELEGDSMLKRVVGRLTGVR
jgi:hypothetical protein